MLCPLMGKVVCLGAVLLPLLFARLLMAPSCVSVPVLGTPIELGGRCPTPLREFLCPRMGLIPLWDLPPGLCLLLPLGAVGDGRFEGDCCPVDFLLEELFRGRSGAGGAEGL